MKKFSKKSKKSKAALKEPPARAGHLMIGLVRGAFVIGGYNNSGPLSDAWMYSESRWSKVAIDKNSPCPFPRLMTDGCAIGPDIYVFAGVTQDNDDVLTLNDLWKLQNIDSEIKWICLHEECSVPERCNHVVVNIPGNRMLIHGGECNGFLGDCWIYDAELDSFQQIASSQDNVTSPCPRASHSAAYCEPFVMLFGGVTSSAILSPDTVSPEESQPIYLNDLWLLDASVGAESSWRMISLNGIAPSPRDLPAVVSAEALTGEAGDVLIFGGYGLYDEDDEVSEERSDGEDQKPSADDIDSEQVAVGMVEAVSPEDVEMTMDTASEQAASPPAPSSTAAPLTSMNPLEASLPAVEATAAVGDHIEDADDGSVSEGYLGDAWIVNIHTLMARDDVCLSNGNISLGDAEMSGWRGMKMVPVIRTSESETMTAKLLCLGGFNGEKFAGVFDGLQIERSQS